MEQNFIPVPQPEQLKKKEEPKTESNFVELPKELGNGQVRRSALEAYEQWENLAKEANEERSFFKKVFLIDKRSAMEFAREEAEKEEKERTQAQERKLKLNEEKETFIRILSESLNNIFFDAGDSPHLEGFQKLVFEDHIDTIFSEDKSGRIPALICKKFLSAVYEEEGKSKTYAFSMPIGRIGSYDYAHDYQKNVSFAISKISELADRNLLGKTVLYITEFIASGQSARTFLDAVAQVMFGEEKNMPSSYLLVMLGARHSYDEGGFWGLSGISMQFNSVSSGGLHGDNTNDGLYECFSGICRHGNSISREHLSKDVMEARREVINRVSEHLMERWREWKEQKEENGRENT